MPKTFTYFSFSSFSLSLCSHFLSILFLLTGCTTQKVHIKNNAVTLQMDEVHFHASEKKQEELGGLDAYDAQSLYQRGQDLIDGQAFEDAAPYFQRVTREFPKSIYARGSYFSLGICHLNLQQGAPALAAFNAFLSSLDDNNPKHKRLSRRGRFRKGAALALLKRYEEVAEIYDILLVEDLTLPEEIEALTDSGIGHYMRGDPITAEYRFMKARRLWRQGSQVERLGVKFFVAQATFYLAELARIEYSEFHLLPPEIARQEAQLSRQKEANLALAQAESQQKESVNTSSVSLSAQAVSVQGESLKSIIRKDKDKDKDNKNKVAEYLPDDSTRKAQHTENKSTAIDDNLSIEELIGKQLEKKCQLLLRAQVSYLRVIREGHAGWASAAGYKVGTLYEDLYDEMTHLPAPEDLTTAQQKLYREVMQERIAILLRKAIGTWEATTQMATRTDSNNEWVEKTRASLERLRSYVESQGQSKSPKAPRELDADEIQS